jgi:hypothetical protein
MVSDALEGESFSASLKAYYKLEGDFTDSSGNGNDLTAQNGAVATDTDSPFSSNEYGIITSATFSTDTTITVFTGKGVPPSENITAPAYSTQRKPYGFPAKKTDWQIKSVLGSTVTQTSTASTSRFTGLEVTMPVGDWSLTSHASFHGRAGSNALRVGIMSLETSSADTTSRNPDRYAAFIVDDTNEAAHFLNIFDDILVSSGLYTLYLMSGTGTNTWDTDIRIGNLGICKLVVDCNYL